MVHRDLTQLSFVQVIENIPDYNNAVIIARNPLGARRATSFADRLKVNTIIIIIIVNFIIMKVNIAVLHGEYKESDERDDEDGRASPPPQAVLPDRTRIFSIGQYFAG